MSKNPPFTFRPPPVRVPIIGEKILRIVLERDLSNNRINISAQEGMEALEIVETLIAAAGVIMSGISTADKRSIVPQHMKQRPPENGNAT